MKKHASEVSFREKLVSHVLQMGFTSDLCRQPYVARQIKNTSERKMRSFQGLRESWKYEKIHEICEKSPVFFSSNLLLCAMRLSGINGCETIVVKCYTLSAQPGAPDNYKRKGERGKNKEMTKTNYDQKEAEVTYYEWRCFYSVIFKV